jgi:short-subunit dehydrogenase
VMELCHLYLPAMCRRGRGGIINVASNAAFQPVPYMAVYAASKAFVLSFSEAVAEEVACKGVAVMALCPGATDTNFWTVAGAWENHRRIMVRPERVVATALRAFERRRSSVIDGLLNKALAFSIRLAPRRLVARLAVYAFRNRNKTVDQGYDISFKPSIKR